MFEQPIYNFLYNTVRGEKDEKLTEHAKQWASSAREKLNQIESDEVKKPYYEFLSNARYFEIQDPYYFVKNRAIRNIEKVFIAVQPFVRDVSIEKKKRAIEAILDLCVKKALDYFEQGNFRSKGWSEQKQIDTLNSELLAPIVNVTDGYYMDNSLLIAAGVV